jgi:uncharacterized protein (DUF1501 family)
MNRFEQSRRQFLRTATLATISGLSVSPFILGLNSLAAMAQGTATSDYRALVCVFLQGGNDGHGTVIATDSESFAAFTQARSGAPGLAYPLADLLPIIPNTPQSGRTFALNPYLTGLQNLFNAGRAAIVANSGTLITPATKAQVNANSGSSARLIVLALRSDCGVAGHRLQRRQCRTYRMGKRGCGPDRKHEHEF